MKHYHPRKANVITHTLIRNSSANLTLLITSWKNILKDLKQLDIQLITLGDGDILAQLSKQSILIERIKVVQNHGRQLEKITRWNKAAKGASVTGNRLFALEDLE